MFKTAFAYLGKKYSILQHLIKEFSIDNVVNAYFCMTHEGTGSSSLSSSSPCWHIQPHSEPGIRPFLSP